MKQSYTVTYAPYPLTNIAFTKTESYVYKLNQGYFRIDFYPIRSTPDDGFIRLIISNHG